MVTILEGIRLYNTHLESLSNKHKALERKIEQETARPQCDSVKISALKRRKLQLKDLITRLEKQPHN
ncbi:MAG: YdcH family protein [Methyloligellaceae bacterium]